MKNSISLIAPVLCLLAGFAGCVSSSELTSAEWSQRKASQYAEINERGDDCYAKVSVANSFGTAEFDIQHVAIRPDTVLWIDSRTELAASAATLNLRSIRFIDPGIGALEGFAIGLTPGAISFLIALTSSKSDAGVGFAVVGVYGGLGGAVVGGIVGAIVGHRTDYIFTAR